MVAHERTDTHLPECEKIRFRFRFLILPNGEDNNYVFPALALKAGDRQLSKKMHTDIHKRPIHGPSRDCGVQA